MLYTFIHSGARLSTIYLQVEAENTINAVQLWLNKLEEASNANTGMIIIERSKIDQMRNLSSQGTIQPMPIDGLKNIWILEYEFKHGDFKVTIIQTAK